MENNKKKDCENQIALNQISSALFLLTNNLKGKSL